MANLLVACDQSEKRENVARHLQQCGYLVIQAETAAVALQLFVTERPQLVVLDLSLVDADALTLLQQMRSLRPEVPVVVAGPDHQREREELAVQAGAWDCIACSEDSLAHLCRTILHALKHADLARQVEEERIAMRSVLENIHRQRQEYTHKLVARVEKMVVPLLDAVRQKVPACADLVENTRTALLDVFSEQGDSFAQHLNTLTPAELRLCHLIRQGKSSKEMASAEGVSVETIRTHRRNIRAKLKLANKQVNLTTYLQSLEQPE